MNYLGARQVQSTRRVYPLSIVTMDGLFTGVTELLAPAQGNQSISNTGESIHPKRISLLRKAVIEVRKIPTSSKSTKP